MIVNRCFLILAGNLHLSVWSLLLTENFCIHGKNPGDPAACGEGNRPAYGGVKPRLAFSLESPLDESEDKLAK